MHVSSRGIIEAVVGVIGALSALVGWASVASVVGTSGGNWTFPALWFSLAALCFLLVAVLYREKAARIAFASAFLLSSFPFAPSIVHAVFIALAAWLFLAGMRRIREDMSLRLRFAFRKSMGVGMFSFSLAVSLLVASEYYGYIRGSAWQDLVPRFSLGEGGGDVVLRIAGTVYPELGKIRDEGTTVDAFLAGVRDQESPSEPPSVIPTGDAAPADQSQSVEAALSLAAGRAEIGALVGRSVSGDEKMSDVLSEALRHKTIAFLSGKKAEQNLPASVLPFVLSLLLFVTVLSVASLLQWFWIAAAAGMMRIFIRSGTITVDRIAVEQETLR